MTTTAPILGAFAIDAMIADGGMGVVYRGHHVGQGVQVAIKVMKHPMDEDGIKEFMLEVEAMAGLDHPGIVMIYDVGVTPMTLVTDGIVIQAGAPYLVMEYASRGTLLGLRPPFKWRDFHRILIALLDALAHAHARGVIHCDIKPANILLGSYDDPRPQLKLTDFGIAHSLYRRADDGDENKGPVGTPWYMAPEQVRGRWRSFGPWTDLYAVGVVAYELVTGDVPFDGRVRDVLLAHLDDEFPPLIPRVEIPAGVSDWIFRMTARNLDHRYRSAAEAARVLQRLTPDEPTGLTELNTSGATSRTGPPTYSFPELRKGTTQGGLAVTLKRGEKEHVKPSSPGPLRQTWDAMTEDEIRLFTGDLMDVTHERDVDPVANTASVPPPPPREPVPSPAEGMPLLPPLATDGARWEWRQRLLPATPLVLQGAGLKLYGLREPRIVAREAERDALWDVLVEVGKRRTPGLVLIEGAPGVGKSRLARWMCERAGELGLADAVYARAAGEMSGLQAAVAAFLRTDGLQGEALLDHLFKYLMPTGLKRDERHAFASLVAAHRRREALVPADEVAAVQRWLERTAMLEPMILWLDDVDQSPADLDFLLQLSARVGALVVVATLSRGAALRSPAVGRDVAELKKRADRVIRLEPMGEDELIELLGRHLSLIPSLAKAVASQASGNPAIALQLLGNLAATEQLIATSRGFASRAGVSLEPPTEVRSFFDEEVALAVGPHRSADREFVEVVAVMDDLADRAHVVDACAWLGIPPSFDAFDRLEAAGLAVYRGDHLDFAHPLVRASILQAASADALARLHAYTKRLRRQAQVDV